MVLRDEGEFTGGKASRYRDPPAQSPPPSRANPIRCAGHKAGWPQDALNNKS